MNTKEVVSDIEFKNSFDTMTAMSGIYLWALFGFVSSSLSSDLHREMSNNIYFRHIISIITFFLLITVMDSENKEGILSSLLKTTIVYILFIMSTKNKLFVSITIFAILVIDNMIKLYSNTLEDKESYNKIRHYLYISLIVVIILGYIHYFIRAKKDFGSKFNYMTFIFGKS